VKECPKCGSWNIVGPRYNVTWSGREELVYTCAHCSFQTSTPTKDAEQRNLQFAAEEKE
jgi:RNase P subunit RPR2